jgi:hypothetical protein
MRFREHGRDKPTIHGDRAEIVAYLRAEFAHWPDLDHLDPADIQSEDLGPVIIRNEQAWWKCWPAMHLVTLESYGVVGYSDAPL